MSRIFITPRDGRVIPMPDGMSDLPAAGKWVNPSAYWTRRIADKDVTVSDGPTSSAPEAASVDAAAANRVLKSQTSSRDTSGEPPMPSAG